MYTDNAHIVRVHGFGQSVSNQVHHVLFEVCNVVPIRLSLYVKRQVSALYIRSFGWF